MLAVARSLLNNSKSQADPAKLDFAKATLRRAVNMPQDGAQAPAEDLYDLLFQAKTSSEPVYLLLTQAMSHRNPMVALVASCFNSGNAYVQQATASVWLFTSQFDLLSQDSNISEVVASIVESSRGAAPGSAADVTVSRCLDVIHSMVCKLVTNRSLHSLHVWQSFFLRSTF